MLGKKKKGKMPPNLPAHMFPYQAEPGLSLSAFSAAASFSMSISRRPYSMGVHLHWWSADYREKKKVFWGDTLPVS